MLFSAYPGETISLLKKAYRRIEDPAHWCQFNYMQTKEGKPAQSYEEADKWCAKAALFTDSDRQNIYYKDALFLLTRVSIEMFNESIVAVNEGWNILPEESHKRVLAIYREAIKRAEEERVDE